jgi:hypothetical protein
MTPRLLIPVALAACAARPAPAPSAIAHAPRAERVAAPPDTPAALPEPARGDAPALVTRARCVDDRLALAAPTQTTEVHCPWGAPDCEGEGAIVLRNCGRAHVKVTALTVLGGSSFGRRWTFTYDPQAFGALEPFTELRVPFPMPPYVDTFEALADVARGPRGVPQALRATTSVRRDALLPPGTSGALGDGASLYAVEAAPDGRWVALCAHEAHGDQAPAAFFSPAGRRDTGASFSLAAASFRASYAAPSGAFHDGGSTWVIDHAGARLRRLPGVQGVRWSREGRVILEHGDALALFDAALEALTELPTASVFPWPRGPGPVVALGRTLVDVAQRRALGRVAGDVLAVTSDGRALVPAVPSSGRWSLPAGPLRWVRPTP